MIRIEIMCNICMAIEIFINCFEKEKGYIYIKKMYDLYIQNISIYIYTYIHHLIMKMTCFYSAPNQFQIKRMIFI